MSITPGIFFVVEILDLRFVPAIDNTVVYFKKKGEWNSHCTLLYIPAFSFFFYPWVLLLLSSLCVWILWLMVVCMAFNFTVGILTLQPWRFYIVGVFLLSIGIFICDCGRSNLCGGELFLLGEFISVSVFFLLLWANSSMWEFFLLWCQRIHLTVGIFFIYGGHFVFGGISFINYYLFVL